ncbi:hypothetical protein pb186bvf_015263 [Paramecium bursaria]
MKTVVLDKFDYRLFLKFNTQNQNFQDSVPNESLSQFKCSIFGHGQKTIESIDLCQLELMACQDCRTGQLHEKMIYKDQAIQEFVVFLNKQMDMIQFEFYFIQMELCGFDTQLADNYIQELKNIENQIKRFTHKSKGIKVDRYLIAQSQTNMGLIYFLYNYYQQIYTVKTNIDKFRLVMRNQLSIDNQNQYIQQNKGENMNQELANLKNSLHLVLLNIIQSIQISNEAQFYKNKLLQKEQEEQIKNEIQKLFEKGKQMSDQMYDELVIQYCDLQIQIDSTSYEAYLYKGISLKNLNRFQEAFEMFDKALLLRELSVEVYFHKGCIYQIQKQYGDAIMMYFLTLQRDNDYVDAIYRQAKLLVDSKEYKHAIDVFKLVLVINTECYESHYQLGFTYFQLQDYENSVGMFKKAIELNPNFVEALIGLSLYKLSRYKDSIYILQKIDEQFQNTFCLMGIQLNLIKNKDNLYIN